MDIEPQTAQKRSDIKSFTWVIYCLWVGGVFINFLPLIALIVLFIKRKEAKGTIYESHFEWILRTFAIIIITAIVVGVLAGALGMDWILPVVTIPIGLWALYRLVKGLFNLAKGRAIENFMAFI